MEHAVLGAHAGARPLRCRGPIKVLGLAVLGIASISSITTEFVAAGGPRRPTAHIGRTLVARQAAEDWFQSPPSGLAQFQGNPWSLWISLLLVVICIPGLASTLQRTGQAKYIEKTYILPASASGGLEMRSIAGGILAYFRSLNYNMEDSPEEGKIRFVGMMQGTLSIAFYLCLVFGGSCVGFAFVLQALFPNGPFDLGWYLWYAPIIFSPWAGWYYWGRAFRRDVVELQLELSDDLTTITLSALGDKETIENLQTGVRFQNIKGQLFRLMEPGMEYQEGLFEVLGWVNQPTVIQKDEQTAKQAA